MRFRVFQYPLPTAGDLNDLNTFLGSQRVATVAHHVAETAQGTMLVFVVETAGGPTVRGPQSAAPKIDYREKLSAEQFVLFTNLRAARKAWADAEGLPVYALFTNAQLAQMATGAIATAADLGRIDGLGPARAEKYAERLLSILRPHPASPTGGAPPPEPVMAVEASSHQP
jgi:superfamily II DNA helicase RecQ